MIKIRISIASSMQVDEKKGTVNSSFYNLIITGRGQHETRINHVTSSHAEIVK